MDFTKLAEDLGLDEDEFWELVELFLETSASDLGRLQSAIDRGDIQQTVEAVHSVKGAAANLGFEEIYELAKGVEEKARENSLDGVTEPVRIIKEKCDLIGEMFRAMPV
ncbi:MAG: Hpt domain-containing protein [Desulfobacterales bacterium]|nr:Hpt domain-containing protein [Desulfobacterales bacterium]